MIVLRVCLHKGSCQKMSNDSIMVCYPYKAYCIIFHTWISKTGFTQSSPCLLSSDWYSFLGFFFRK